jgi:hypothetical protein
MTVKMVNRHNSKESLEVSDEGAGCYGLASH